MSEDEDGLVNWIRCLVETRHRKSASDKLLGPILHFLSDQDRETFRNLPKHMQDREDLDIIEPNALPDVNRESNTHVKRFTTPAKYSVA